MISIVAVVLVISICFLVPNAAAQSDKYSKMAPVGEYLMERNAEILLARSAAPDSIYPATRRSWSWDGKAMKQLSEERTGAAGEVIVSWQPDGRSGRMARIAVGGSCRCFEESLSGDPTNLNVM